MTRNSDDEDDWNDMNVWVRHGAWWAKTLVICGVTFVVGFALIACLTIMATSVLLRPLTDMK